MHSVVHRKSGKGMPIAYGRWVLIGPRPAFEPFGVDQSMMIVTRGLSFSGGA